jgi:hypothetical protein
MSKRLQRLLPRTPRRWSVGFSLFPQAKPSAKGLKASLQRFAAGSDKATGQRTD